MCGLCVAVLGLGQGKGPFPEKFLLQKKYFVKCDWLTLIFRWKLKIFQLLTMIFSENFLSVEILVVVLNCGLGTEFNTTTTIDVRSYIISKELV
jgi:hypothetical protein